MIVPFGGLLVDISCCLAFFRWIFFSGSFTRFVYIQSLSLPFSASCCRAPARRVFGLVVFGVIRGERRTSVTLYCSRRTLRQSDIHSSNVGNLLILTCRKIFLEETVSLVHKAFHKFSLQRQTSSGICCGLNLLNKFRDAIIRQKLCFEFSIFVEEYIVGFLPAAT